MRAVWCLALCLTACGELAAGEPELAVPTVAVHRGSLTQTLLLSGELEAEHAVSLLTPRTQNWQVAIKWLAEDGAAVAKGDRVVEFDNSAVVEKLADLEITVVEAAVELETQRAETAVQVAEKEFAVETQKTAVAKAELDASVPAHLVSRRELQDGRLALERAQVALTTAQREVAALRSGGRLEEQVKRVAYDKAMRAYSSAGEQLDALVLTAPRDGIVLVGKLPWEDRKLQVGDVVMAGLQVAQLPDLSKTLVRARLSDVDEGRLTPGMKVTCTVDAFPDVPLAGFVRSVSPVAQSASRNSSRQAFDVLVALDDALPEDMRPGLSVKVVVPSRVVEDALLVPRRALDFEAAPTRVVLEDGTTADVVVGPCDAQNCVVESGLTQGQLVRVPGGAA